MLFISFLTSEIIYLQWFSKFYRLKISFNIISGIETLSDYKVKYGRNPLLELPLAVNPTGCARSEGKPKGWKRAHTQRALRGGSGAVFPPSAPLPGELACPYSKQFVHSNSSQYQKMKQEWRNNVYLARY